MPRNYNRKVVERRKLGFLDVMRYNTGALTVSDNSRNRLVLSLTNTDSLHTSGYLQKLTALLIDKSTFRLQSRMLHGIKLEYKDTLKSGVQYILDSDLSSEAKLTFIISYLFNGIVLSDSTLQVIFKARPDPMGEIDRIRLTMRDLHEEILLKRAIYPDFMGPRNQKQKTEESYLSYCRTVSFLSSPRAISYGEYIAKHEEDFFVPTFPRTDWSNSQLFTPISLDRVADLRPLEYERFMSYYNTGVLSELRPWARKRFDDGVVTTKELQVRGSITKPLEPKGWIPVMNYLTIDEARDFASHVAKPNGIGQFYRGADPGVASLIAFYWVEGGPERLDELIMHVSKIQASEMPGEFGTIQRMTHYWKNPYADTRGRRPDFRPYVKVITDPESKHIPLEWALASF